MWLFIGGFADDEHKAFVKRFAVEVACARGTKDELLSVFKPEMEKGVPDVFQVRLLSWPVWEAGQKQ